MHFSKECVARGLTVIGPTTAASFFRMKVAWVCDAMEAWAPEAWRVRSSNLSKTQMIATICFKFDGSRGSNQVRSLLVLEHCASPTVDG